MTPAATTMSQNASASPYVEGEVHPNTKSVATFETKPRTYTRSGWDSGSGYEHWRSFEQRPHTARQGKEDVYASHHRLLAVVACYDLQTPIGDVLEDLRGRDVHHQSGVEFDNRPQNLEVLDHGRHSSITQSQMRAWGEDAKQQALNDTHDDSSGCPGCGREDVDVVASSAGFVGMRCLECAQEECGGEPIDLDGGAR